MMILFFLQTNEGTVTGGAPVNDQNITKIKSDRNIIGGFIQLKSQSGESIYWVPKFTNGSYRDGEDEGHSIRLFDTDKGRPETKPTSAEINKLLTKSNSDVTEILIYLDIFSDSQL